MKKNNRNIENTSNNKKGIILAIVAAALYAINTPVSKLLLVHIPSTLLAGLLYLGAGLGMLAFGLIQRARGKSRDEVRLGINDTPYVAFMIVLDVVAPILLLLGLSSAMAENVSLLNNFEIVATALIAFLFFGEKISKRLAIAIGLITISSAILSFESVESLKFSTGSLLVIAAACCWGIENNCTRKISDKDPLQIVIIKGLCSGAGSLVIGLTIGEKVSNIGYIAAALALGFVAYGLSIFVYVYAQRMIGAARTGAYYAIAPFIGSTLSLLMFPKIPTASFFVAIGIMGVGSYLASKE